MDKVSLKKLPIGEQSFQSLRMENRLYVDKTEHLYNLLNSEKVYFLSRPRRFGKSLTISTLEAIFRNQRHLFKDLWIDSSDYEWKEYPIIKLDMSVVGKDTVEILAESLKLSMNTIAKTYALELKTTQAPSMFAELINALVAKTGEPVAILIDEYDDPIIKHVSDTEKADANRNVLQDFYKIMKSESANLRFVMLTGVSKFAKTSIFSGLNNLENISMDEKYAALTGYTQEELEKYFPEYIERLAKNYSVSTIEALKQIKYWYNGYHFSTDKHVSVYNPFSTLLLFNTARFKTHWFETGTPTYLTKLIRRDWLNVQDFEENIKVSEDALQSYNVEDVPIIPLLYDTGYLTIKDSSVKNFITSYVLAYPNFEVRMAFTEHLLKAYSGERVKESLAIELSEALEAGDIDALISVLRPHFASIPYDVIPKVSEKYFQLVFLLAIRSAAFRVVTEERTNSGRIDLLIEIDDKVIVFEFKVDSSAEIALKQIKDKRYYEKFLTASGKPLKKILLVGINFSSIERNMSEYLTEEIEP